MKYKSSLVIAVILLVASSALCSALSKTGNTGDRGIKLQVLPFTYDSSPNAELVSDQAAFLLHRLLRAGRFILPEFVTLKDQGIPAIWNTQEQIDDFCLTTAIDWLVVGHVEKIATDTEAEMRGNRFWGMAGVPIKAEITIVLYDCHRKQEVWKDCLTAKIRVPRLKVFGMNKKPFPKTVKTADAFVYDTMLAFSEQIITVIQSFGLEKEN